MDSYCHPGQALLSCLHYTAHCTALHCQLSTWTVVPITAPANFHTSDENERCPPKHQPNQLTYLMSPSPVRMADSDVDLMSKCLEFCQSLESRGRSFKLSIKLGNFSFSLDSKDTTPKGLEKKKKKLSPSQLKRNQRRREEYLQKKLDLPEETSKEQTHEKEFEPEVSPKCNVCDKTFGTDRGLKQHIGKAHKTENLRSHFEATSLKSSPVKEVPREEKCECCGEVMAPKHQCESEEESEEEDEEGKSCSKVPL